MKLGAGCTALGRCPPKVEQSFHQMLHPGVPSGGVQSSGDPASISTCATLT